MRDILRRYITFLGIALSLANVAVDIYCRLFSPEMPSGMAYEFENETVIFKWFIWLNAIPDSLTGWLLYPFSRPMLPSYTFPHWFSLLFKAIFFILVAVQWMLIGYCLTWLIKWFSNQIVRDAYDRQRINK